MLFLSVFCNNNNCAYHAQFSKEKVVWIELVDQGRFAYDETGKYIDATAFMISGEMVKYLCAFLNSRIAHWYIQKTAPTSGMGVFRWKKTYVEKIPAFRPHPSFAKVLINLVNEAQSLPTFDEKRLTQIEHQINQIFYNVYSLSINEVKNIEESTETQNSKSK